MSSIDYIVKLLSKAKKWNKDQLNQLFNNNKIIKDINLYRLLINVVKRLLKLRNN